jgi:CheY-like chemotaxis protein
LGLPTVLGIVRSHGGFLNVDSQLGRGTTFAVFLPASRSAVSGADGSDTPAPPRGNGETILLVDDEPAVLTVAASMLQANGYQVQQATEGASAVAAYVQGKDRISLVVTDIMMPLMDGVALIQALRRVNPAVPIITVSGLAGQPGQSSRLAEIQALGIRHHLGKPYSTEALLEAIHAELHPTG